jgi:hypothetical protein
MAKHHTFFGKVFGSLWDIIKKPFDNANHPFLEIAINITNLVKDALNSGIVSTITTLIPGALDDKIVEILKEKLPILLADELLIQAAGTPTNQTDAEALAKQLVDSFGGLADDRKERFYTSLAADIYIFLQQHEHGEKVTFGEAAAFVEVAYKAYLQSKG